MRLVFILALTVLGACTSVVTREVALAKTDFVSRVNNAEAHTVWVTPKGTDSRIEVRRAVATPTQICGETTTIEPTCFAVADLANLYIWERQLDPGLTGIMLIAPVACIPLAVACVGAAM